MHFGAGLGGVLGANGEGVTEAERAEAVSRVPEDDNRGFSSENYFSARLIGSASKANRIHRFDISLFGESRSLGCDARLSITSDSDTVVRYEFDVREAFVTGHAPRRVVFEPFVFADAEGNRDGVTSGDELRAVRLTTEGKVDRNRVGISLLVEMKDNTGDALLREGCARMTGN